MKKYWFVLPLFVLFCWAAITQKETSSSDNQNVNINNDDIWNISTAVQTDNLHPPSVVHFELPKPRPNDQIIKHTGYTLSYNSTYNIANWVAYELTAAETKPVVQRNNQFIPDPLLNTGKASNEDYKGTGYDRGHLAPAADMCYSYQTMVESFYLTNITPQAPSFNRDIWEKLEEQVRQWAIDDKDIYVVTGTVLTVGLPTIGHDRITIPTYFYKVILDYRQPDPKGIGFIIPNQGSQESIKHFAVTIDSVEKVTGTDFFYQLPEDQQRIIESTIDLSKWNWTNVQFRNYGPK